jgi:hypothetical protein
VEKILSGGKCLYFDTNRVNQPSQRSTNGLVIVNDVDNPAGLSHGVILLSKNKGERDD